ncbi:phospholipid scramblase family protein C343.06c isoform X2 [Triticum aestivum]|uniref:phospholipid scramblase family protein C343.06c isoform X2 n=1 Tax=Triticum aestivum TaxID=4565 RepID=UPI001D0309BF|nr:phospholipid scramblase family protein C343.06c-like isoform X2 [Triticum aestivum]
MSWNRVAAAAAGRVSARTTARRGFASAGGARRGRRPAAPQPWPWAWLRGLWHAEPKKQRGAAKRPGRRAAEGDGKVSPGDAAPSFVSSKAPALESGGGTAGEEGAPSGICQHQDLDPARVQAKLKPLLTRARLIITRKVEWASIMFAYAQETRYIIKDPRTPRRKTPVGLIREKSNVILRQLLWTRRPFVAEFTDARGNEIFTVRRPFRWINSSIYAEVDGKVGVVHSRWHLWRRNYDLYLGNRQFAVVENPGFWSWSFALFDEDDNLVAIIDRKVRGVGWECMQHFTNASQYEVRFGDAGKGTDKVFCFAKDMDNDLRVFLPLDLPERAVALALAVSLDHDCFSRRRLGWVLRLLGA